MAKIDIICPQWMDAQNAKCANWSCTIVSQTFFRTRQKHSQQSRLNLATLGNILTWRGKLNNTTGYASPGFGGEGGKINNFTLEQGKKTAFKAPKVNCRHLRRKKVLMRPSFRLYVLINRSGSSGKVPRRHSNVRHGQNKSLRSANLDMKTARLQS